jgi:hypothetical protein
MRFKMGMRLHPQQRNGTAGSGLRDQQSVTTNIQHNRSADTARQQLVQQYSGL